MSTVDPIPAAYPRVTPYLSVDGAADAIDFYCDIFGAVEKVRMGAPGDKIGHAELEVGGSMIMLADFFPERSGPTPRALGGSPVTLMVYVADVDDVFARAIKAGAKEITPVQDQFYGDRSGMFEDPFGHWWNVASHVEDVSPEQMASRAAALSGDSSP